MENKFKEKCIGYLDKIKNNEMRIYRWKFYENLVYDFFSLVVFDSIIFVVFVLLWIIKIIKNYFIFVIGN